MAEPATSGHKVHFCQDNESMSSYGVMRGLQVCDSPFENNVHLYK
ncbi:hypothetical protein F7D95_06880 [Prevotella copri]|uniref:Uncharacterized protein n=1 Tax=Segatella copri TaxID=165179 RepID=A0AA90UFB5_9BACT|nr:hypothetical protein [Segatella copri]